MAAERPFVCTLVPKIGLQNVRRAQTQEREKPPVRTPCPAGEKHLR